MERPRYVATATGATAAPTTVAPSPSANAATATGGGTAHALTAAHQVEGTAGAGHEPAVPLTDGRTLWTFQDAFLPRPHWSHRAVRRFAEGGNRG
jgi:hypothetical protein